MRRFQPKLILYLAKTCILTCDMCRLCPECTKLHTKKATAFKKAVAGKSL